MQLRSFVAFAEVLIAATGQGFAGPAFGEPVSVVSGVISIMPTDVSMTVSGSACVVSRGNLAVAGKPAYPRHPHRGKFIIVT